MPLKGRIFMTICYFGLYKKDYYRNENIILGLRKNGINIIELRDKSKGLKKFLNLYKKHKPFKNDYDIMMVGFPGQIMVPLAKLISHKPVILDLHVSLYDSIIFERKLYKPQSLKARWFYFLDWLACSLADKILLDTQVHIDYIFNLLHIKREKFLLVPNSANDDLFKPIIKSEKTNDKFIVGFYGFFHKIDGLDLVIRAMQELVGQNIELWLIGAGPESFDIKNLSEKELGLNNIKFYPVMPPHELIKKIHQFDLGLGLFSPSQRVDRIIANRILEFMAMQIPVLTIESRACQEYFNHQEHIYYCRKDKIESITSAILELKNNLDLRKKISKNAYNYVEKNLLNKVVGEKFLTRLRSDFIGTTAGEKW